MELDPQLVQKVASYSPSQKELASIRDVALLYTVGITAAGKGALLNRLFEKYPEEYIFTVSHTTRAPRSNNGIMEQEGIDYYFVDAATMEQMIDEQKFIEVQVIHNRAVSGSSVDEVRRVQAQRRIPISDIDVQGVDTYVSLGLNIKPIFVLPPSYDVWMTRLLRRYDGKLQKPELIARMQSAIKEIEHALTVDYFYIVINDELDDAVEVVNDIGHGEPVEQHYPKAISIAEQLLDRIRQELAKMV